MSPQDDTIPTDGHDRLVGGRYRLLARLGRGGMGVVWSARDELLHRDVAVKEVTPPPGLDQGQSAQLRERTMREARAAARIASSAAVTVFDVVQEDDRPWIVMELLPPRSLADELRSGGPLPESAAAALGLRLLDALSAAHGAGVLHRDVKPSNVLYDASGQAVLTDFGIASLEGDPSTTTTGSIVGSPGYVAPERAHGEAPGVASDLWSLGVTLAAAVHGASPFERDTALATLVAAVHDPLPPHVSDGPLGDVIGRLLDKDPSTRADAAEARRLLGAHASGRASTDRAGPLTDATAVRALDRPGRADAERTQALPVPVRGPAAAATAVVPAAGAPTAVAPAFARSTGSGRRVPLPTDTASRPAGPVPGPTAPSHRRGVPVLVAVVALVVAGMVLAVVLDRRAPDAGTAAPAVAASEPGASTEAEAEPAPTAAEQPAPEQDPETPAQEEQPEPGQAPEGPAEGPADDPDRDGAPGTDPAPGTAPDGFQLYEDDGYVVAVPDGWAVEPDGGNRTRFVDPRSRRYLLVEEGGRPAGDPVADWERQEQPVSQRLDGYERIGIERADYRDFDSADWQFTWEPDGGTLRVLNRAVVDTDLDRAYALYWSVPAEEWDDSAPVFADIAASFQPVG